VVLVQHEAVDAHLLGIDVMLQVLVIELAAGDRMKYLLENTSAVAPNSRPSSQG
jgi:hypothetical protein